MSPARGTRRFLLVVSLLAGTAWARSPEAVPPDPDQFPDSFRAGWAWRANPSLPAGHVTDVAVRQDGAIAALDEDGTVWVSADGGTRWRRALAASRGFGAASSDEDLLLGVEARLGEILAESGASTSLDDGLTEEEAEELAAQAVQALEEATRDAADEVRADLGSDPLLDTSQRVGLPGRVWFLGDTLVVGRIDGTYASEDLGELWNEVLDVQVTAITRGPSGWVIGTTDGVRVGGAPETWADLPVQLDGLVVWDAATDARGVHLASEEGLWHSSDGRRWLGEGVLDEAVHALLPDVDTDRMWLATADAVKNGGDGGRTLLESPADSPGGVTSLIRVGPDHLLTAGATGVWETIDGGESWSPLTRGLFARTAHALVVQGDDVWLAAEGGLFRMRAEDGDVPELALVPWIDVETLVDAAMARGGVRAERSGSRIAASMMPRLIVQGQYIDRSRLRYSANPELEVDIYDGEILDVNPGGGAGRTTDDDWYVQARLQWTPRKRSNDVGGQATIVGDDLVFDVAEADVGPMLDRLGAAYGVELSRSVAELYYQRQALASERPAVTDRPILEQVVHELRIREIEARLDALTDGALTAWQRKGEGG